MPTQTIDPLFQAWPIAIGTTFLLMGLSSLVAVFIGLPSAFCASVLSDVNDSTVSSIAGKRNRLTRMLVLLWSLAMLVSMVTPLILHAAAWESIAGKFGWLLKTNTGGNLLWVAWIHGVHGSSIVALASFFGTSRIHATSIAHGMLDYRLASRWWGCYLAIAKHWVIGSIIFVMLLAATEMSVADLHSVRTVADQFYLFYALDPTMTSVAMATWIPLVVAGGPSILWLLLRHRHAAPSNSPFDDQLSIQRDHQSHTEISTKPILLASIGIVLTLIVTTAPMIAGLAAQAGHSVTVQDGHPKASWSLVNMIQSLWQAPSLFADEYFWTIQLALLTALLVTPIAWMAARISLSETSHSRFGIGPTFDSVATLLFIVPGPVVGMVVVKIFSGNSSISEFFATQTLVPTILAVSIRSGVVAYFLIKTGYQQIDSAVWQASRLDGSRFWRIWRVEWPLLRRVLGLAFIAAMLVSSGDVPSMLPVLPPGVTTVGTRLFGLLHSGARFQEASLAFWYVSAVLALAIVLFRFSQLNRSEN